MKKLLTFILIFSIQILSAQVSKLPEVIPPSPEAASLGKFAETPIGYQTGIPSIGIPLYTLDHGGITVPVSLNYHAGGIKVSENASWVGLGWSLSAGGLVTRQIRGKADDSGSNGYLSNPTMNNLQNFNTFATLATYDEIKDYEPDMYIYNFNGFSGKFFINAFTGEPELHEHDDVKITKIMEGTKFGGWIIRTPEGIEYYFGKNKDKTLTANSRLTQEASFSHDHVTGQTTNFPLSTEAIDSWYLLEIYNPNTKQNVTFSYTGIAFDSEFGIAGTSRRFNPFVNFRVSPNVINSKETMFYKRKINGIRQLTDITAGKSKISFTASAANREDLEGGRSLDKIEMSYNDTLRKSYELKYGYFTATQTAPWTYWANTSYRKKRMYLDKLYEKGSNGESLPPYEFTYNTAYGLPDKLSSSTDFWGFYNAKNLNSLDQLPSVEIYSDERSNSPDSQTTPNFFKPGADRSVHPLASQAGMLIQIKNPLGGTTQYDYESNKTMLDQTPVPTDFPNSLDDYSEKADIGVPLIKRSIFHNPLQYSFSASFWEPPTPFSNIHRTVGTVHTKEFEIPNLIYGDVKIQTTILGCESPTEFFHVDCYYNIQIKGITDPSFTMSIANASITTIIPAGRYKIIATRQKAHPYPEFQNDIVQDFMTIITWNQQENLAYKLVGGQRIKEIRYNPDGIGETIVKRYTYNNSGTGMSSGRLYSIPLNKSFIQGTTTYESCPMVPTFFETYQMDVFDLSSNSLSPLGSLNGSPVMYDEVREEYFGGTDAGYNVYFYDSYPFVGNYHQHPYTSLDDYEWRSGKQIGMKAYKPVKNGNLTTYLTVKEEIMKYEEMRGTSVRGIAFSTLPCYWVLCVTPIPCPDGSAVRTFKKYHIYNAKRRLIEKKEFLFEAGQTIENKTTYSYSPNGINLVRSSIMLDSEQDVAEKKFFYSADVSNANSLSGGAMTSLQLSAVLDSKSQNNISTPIQVEEYNNSELLSTQRTLFKDWDPGTAKMVLPEIIKASKGAGILESRVRYTRVDPANGNPLEVQQESGMKICYIWGYGMSLPVAKIKNIAYASIPQSLITDIQTASDAVPYSETVMLQKLDALRMHASLADAAVSTFTHRPLVGMSSATDLKGDRTTYEYDAFNRLKAVRDKDGNLLSENQYHYKNQ